MPSTDVPTAGDWDVIPRQSRVDLRRPLRERHGEQKDGVATRLPMRRPCPSALQRRLISKTPVWLTTGSSSSSHTSHTRAAAAQRELRPDGLLSVSSCALVERSTDVAGHTRNHAYATMAAGDSDSSSSSSNGREDQEDAALHSCVVEERRATLAASLSPTYFFFSRDVIPAEGDGSPKGSTGAARETSRQLMRSNSDPVRTPRPHSDDSYRRGVTPALCTLADAGKGTPSEHASEAPSSPPSLVALEQPEQRRAVPLPTTAHIHDEANAPTSLSVVVSKANTLITAAETGLRGPGGAASGSRITPHTESTHTSAHSSAQRARPVTPVPTQSVVLSMGGQADWQDSILQHSCSLTRLMQRHQQQGWREELQSALQQDVDVWVRQVGEEQHLLQAQLTFTQAKVVELTQELQRLRNSCSYTSGAASPSPLPCLVWQNDSADGSAKSAALSEKRGDCVYADALTARGELPGGQQSAEHEAEVTCLPAYILEMETYIHFLEAHTRALHDEKQQLQLRLDQRTSQLASAQRRYEQNYALLLDEQAILEADHLKATQHVEEVVGLLVVARAAEQAALRRLNEYELALEEAELRVVEMEAQQQEQQHASPLKRWKKEGVASQKDGDKADVVAASKTTQTAHTPVPHLSTPGSVYYSCMEANDVGEAAPATASPSPFSSSQNVAPPPLRNESALTPFTSLSPTRRTPPLLSPPSHSIPTTPLQGRPSMCATLVSPSDRPRSRRFSAKALSSKPAATGETGVRKESALPTLAIASTRVCDSPSPASASLSLFDAFSPAAGVPTSLAEPLPLSTPSSITTTPNNAAGGSDAAAETKDHASTSLPRSPARSGSRLLTPLASSLAALLTPRGRAVQHSTTPHTTAWTLNDPHGTRDERELLQFKCTLLELELQAKEKRYKEEKARWEEAVHHAEGLRTVMGEAEARVRQVQISSNKVMGLLHEMNRVWRTSLALEAQGESDAEEEAAEEMSREHSPPEAFDEERLLRQRPSRTSITSAFGQRGQRAEDGAVLSVGKLSPESFSDGREFFGVHRPHTF